MDHNNTKSDRILSRLLGDNLQIATVLLIVYSAVFALAGAVVFGLAGLMI